MKNYLIAVSYSLLIVPKSPSLPLTPTPDKQPPGLVCLRIEAISDRITPEEFCCCDCIAAFDSSLIETACRTLKLAN